MKVGLPQKLHTGHVINTSDEHGMKPVMPSVSTTSHVDS